MSPKPKHREVCRENGIRPANVALSASGETVHIHMDREVASRVAMLLHAEGDAIWFGTGDLRDAMDAVLLSQAQPASVSNRPVPYFPMEKSSG